MATTNYDAIIVGSGITGGWAAKELTEKGLNTLVLEAGRSIVPDRDYVEHVPVWELKHRGFDNRAERERTQPIQRECYYACDEYSHQFFVNDKDNPYSTDPGKHFSWIRGRQVGGKSIMWGRQSYRWSDLDFEANSKEGIAIDWPIRYKDIAPWYDYVEEFAGISGQTEGLPQLPDGKFLPPMEMTCVELDMKDALVKHYDDRMMTIGRSAVLTRVHKGRAACHYCGVCHRGCITGSYFSSLSSTLPAAQKTGRLTMRPYSVVHSLMYDSNARRVSGVRVIDAQSKNALEFKARIFFICASTLESTRILLNSATPEFPNGLANSSGELGHNLMDHHMGSGASGEMPGHEDKMPFGNRPNGIYIPRFRNVKTKHRDFYRGYGYQGGGSREGWSRGMNSLGIGADFKNSLKMPGPWRFGIGGFGECLPNHNNFVEVDKEKTDAWGVPTLKIHC
ncbi:MAG TPA: GMC family oxidoreductase [Candidatus Acidoferrales bacterium]|nr:GMC family oxidoreductase [Candidatus Acidoferrales bacterium]